MSDEVVGQLPKCLKGAEVKIFTTDGEIFEGKVYQTYDGKKPKLMVCELRVDGVLQVRDTKTIFCSLLFLRVRLYLGTIRNAGFAQKS